MQFEIVEEGMLFNSVTARKTIETKTLSADGTSSYQTLYFDQDVSVQKFQYAFNCCFLLSRRLNHKKLDGRLWLVEIFVSKLQTFFLKAAQKFPPDNSFPLPKNRK